MDEIPLIWSGEPTSNRYSVVASNGGREWRVIPTTSNNKHEETTTNFILDESRRLQHLKGCAATCRMDNGATAVTAALYWEHASVISLSLIESKSPKSIELDLSGCSLKALVIVKSSVFSHDDDSLLTWHLVDEHANVISISLSTKSESQKTTFLKPISVSYSPVMQWLQSSTPDDMIMHIPSKALRSLSKSHGVKSLSELYEGSLPRPSAVPPRISCVEFLNAETLLLALPSTYLLCIHLYSRTIYPWISQRSVYQNSAQRKRHTGDPTGRKSSGVADFFWGMLGTNNNTDEDEDYDDDSNPTNDFTNVPDYEFEWRKARNLLDGTDASQMDAFEDVDDDYVYPMDRPSSTAAIAVLRPSSPSSNVIAMTLVFTLHADGQLRKWTVLASVPRRDSSADEPSPFYKQCLPVDVHALRTLIVDTAQQSSPILYSRGPPIPSSREWSPTPNALTLGATFWNSHRQYALTLSVQTMMSSTLTVLLLHGPTHFTKYGYIPGASHLEHPLETAIGSALEVPASAVGVSSICVAPSESSSTNLLACSCSVFALYETELLAETGHSSHLVFTNSEHVKPAQASRIVEDEYLSPKACLVFYRAPIQGSEVEPSAWSEGQWTLDHLADLDNDETAVSNFSSMSEVNAHYLKRLFRSSRPRVMAPSHAILEALKYACPFEIPPKNPSNTLETHVLLFMQEWTRQMVSASATTNGHSKRPLEDPIKALVARWKSLIHALWTVEASILRRPLRVSYFDKDVLLLVRSGVVTTLSLSTSTQDNILDLLNVACLGLYQKCPRKIEFLMQSIVESAAMLSSPPPSVSQIFCDLSVQLDKDGQFQKVLQTITSLSPEDVSDWIFLFPQVPPSPASVAAVYQCQLYMLKAQQISTMKALLCEAAFGGSEYASLATLAFRSALEVMAFNWACSQPVQTISNASNTRSELILSGKSKSNSASKIKSSKSNVKSLLEAQLDHLTSGKRRIGASTATVIHEFCSKYVGSAQGIALYREEGESQFSKGRLSPRIALRLLAPALTYPVGITSHNLMERQQQVGVCLLGEAAFVDQHYHSTHRNVVSKYRHAAVALWQSSEQNTWLAKYYNRSSFSAVMEVLKQGQNSENHDETLEEERRQRVEEALIECLIHHRQSEMLDQDYEDSSKAIAVTAARIVTVPSIVSLLWNFITSSTRPSALEYLMDNHTISFCSFLASADRVALRLHFLSLVEMHCGNAHLSLIVVKSALDALQDFSMTKDMTEYANLWSAAHRFALLCHQWDEAYHASFANPVARRRNENVRRLVTQMIACGSLQHLLKLPQQVHYDVIPDLEDEENKPKDALISASLSTRAAGDIFYEVAATALQLKAKEDSLAGRHDSAAEYFEALYALMVHREDWRKAAQATINWQATLGGASTPYFSLAALASANALRLEPDASLHFIVNDDTKQVTTVEDLDRKALLSQCQVLLQQDSKAAPATQTNAEYSEAEFLIKVIYELADAGYFSHAISLILKLARCPTLVTPEEQAVMLSNVACRFIVPNKLKRPTIAQSAAVAKRCPIAGLNQEDLTMLLLREMVCRHAAPTNTLAQDVARAFLDDNSQAKLPIWLTDLIIGDKDQQGLFARCPARKQSYQANPAALLKLYMERGLFVEATQVVTRVLMCRQETTAVPEKGDIEYVPYSYIDTLYRMIEESNQVKFEPCLQEIASALKQHFRALAEVETGLKSSRMLHN